MTTAVVVWMVSSPIIRVQSFERAPLVVVLWFETVFLHKPVFNSQLLQWRCRQSQQAALQPGFCLLKIETACPIKSYTLSTKSIIFVNEKAPHLRPSCPSAPKRMSCLKPQLHCWSIYNCPWASPNWSVLNSFCTHTDFPSETPTQIFPVGLCVNPASFYTLPKCSFSKA